MEPVVSAVMVVLWCTPDMLFCRRPPIDMHQPVYTSFLECERALRGRLAEAKRDDKIVVGRCQETGSSSDVVNWGISPNRELLTSVAPVEAPVPDPAEVSDAMSGGSTTGLRAEAEHDYTMVRVIRGLGREAQTTSYVVKRSTQ